MLTTLIFLVTYLIYLTASGRLLPFFAQITSLFQVQSGMATDLGTSSFSGSVFSQSQPTSWDRDVWEGTQQDGMDVITSLIIVVLFTVLTLLGMFLPQRWPFTRVRHLQKQSEHMYICTYIRNIDYCTNAITASALTSIR
jgi:hypothetical protein